MRGRQRHRKMGCERNDLEVGASANRRVLGSAEAPETGGAGAAGNPLASPSLFRLREATDGLL